MKKAVVKIPIALLLAALCIFIFTGSTCLSDPKPLPYERREVGDFIVRFYDDYCEIEGTTEQGNSQRFLVIPEYIEGVKVKSLGFASLISDQTVPQIKSDILEKVYFEIAIEVNKNSFVACSNIKKVFYPKFNEYSRYGLSGADVYFPHKEFEENNNNRYGIECANISYYYNYENSKKSGYYWIDDYDYDSRIEFIPPDPKREGYTFGGWYKEPECINKWDFNIDTLPKKKTEMEESYENGEHHYAEVITYQETILYAKWIED